MMMVLDMKRVYIVRGDKALVDSDVLLDIKRAAEGKRQGHRSILNV